ncbi:hypothetical protein SBADM41S_11701 [Streptomyces badius]
MTPGRRSLGNGRYGTGIRTSDQVIAHNRRWLACLRTASSTTGVVNTPMPSRMKEIEITASTNRATDTVMAAANRSSPRPAASIDGRNRPVITFIVDPLPSPEPGRSPVRCQFTRSGLAASAGPPPDRGVPGNTPAPAPYASAQEPAEPVRGAVRARAHGAAPERGRREPCSGAAGGALCRAAPGWAEPAFQGVYLYPTRRTVWIERRYSAPNLRRSRATWTSTVRPSPTCP